MTSHPDTGTAVPLLVLSDQMVVSIIGDPRYQEVFPLFKAFHSQYKVPKGCRCNSGRRKRETIEKVKSYLLELPGEQKAKLKTMLGAQTVRIAGKQHGKPVVVTIK